MAPEAAQLLLGAAQVYAERHPRIVEVEERFFVDESAGFDGVQTIGDVSPCGMCVVRWTDRRITWSNNAYRQHFVDLKQRLANIGQRIDEVIPAFTESGLETIFQNVAESGEPFHADAFPLDMPEGPRTFWDWSLTTLPTAVGDDLCLLVQMHRVSVPQLAVVA